MFYKIQRKLQGIKCAVDILQYENEILTVKGWIFSPKYQIEVLGLCVECEHKNYTCSIDTKLKRPDVYKNFNNDNARKSGFWGQAVLENMESFRVYLVYKLSKKKYQLNLGVFSNIENINKKLPPRLQEIDNSNHGINLAKLLREQESYQFGFSEKFFEKYIDVIVPVYNGFEYLGKLLNSIKQTRMQYRLILIDDCSPDKRVFPYLKKYAEERDNVIILKNEVNQGFVKTVNRGFEICENDVALVNTDVELPELWLERLMKPIFENKQIASATPYTNCGTICSFPELGQDNELYLEVELEDIDKEFATIAPNYTELPTGVGFCMGMSHEAIQRIGVFDETFGMGYGEENDWCQRAIQNGYKNVHVENLFVYHKHGGSFLSEDKKRYLQENEKKLLMKHPYYNKDVARFFTIDPNREVREFIKLKLIKNNEDVNLVLAFDHNLGGGATKYLSGKKDEYIKKGYAFCVIRFDFIKNNYNIIFYYKDEKIKLHVKTIGELKYVIEYLNTKEVWINELATYPDLYSLLQMLEDVCGSKNIRVTMLVHDFFAVCPTINLLDSKNGVYCGIPEPNKCNECLKCSISEQDIEYEDIETWRKNWLEFFDICTEVVVFSEDSRNIIRKVFGKIDNIVVKPHVIDYIPELKKEYKITRTLNVGLLGMLTKHKGRTLVCQLSKLLEQENMDVRLILIGSASKKIDSPIFMETGRYTRDSIPKLVLEKDIDIFLIPSIWPETFSYTTEEVMTMKMPIMCFDIGAPAERVKKYEKGIVIPQISAKAVLSTLKTHPVIKECREKENRHRKVLFCVEDITFSSRYRVEHLREQLLQKGIASECVSINDVTKAKIKECNSIVVYRSSKVDKVHTIVQKAHKYYKKVYYDIDDYIFDYNDIIELKFLEGEDYIDFENYSNDIRKSMNLCDSFIVSTVNLKYAIEKSFPGKKVFINRNVASMEMLTISLEKKVCEKKKDGIIRLGYFSGTKTHNEDFESIKDVLIGILRKYDNVHLLIGGQINLPKEFENVKTSVEKFEFVSWKKLPKLIAKADINLMPLENTIFHTCKSENKWMEAGLVHVPTIASKNSELELVIEDGVDGYLCETLDEWNEKIECLICNEQLREKLAEEAHKKVLQRYTTFYMEEDVLDELLSN